MLSPLSFPARFAITSALAATVALGGCTRASDAPRDEAPPEAVSERQLLPPAEFNSARIRLKGALLDVRTPGEVARGRIAGASTIDWNGDDFARKASLMNRDTPLFVYCHSGGRSRRAVEKLRSLGFKQVYDLEGGISAWIGAQLPVEKSAAPTPPPAPETTPAAFDGILKAHSRVLAEFNTQWCTPCREMAPIVAKLKKEMDGKAHIEVIDVEASERLATREKAQGVPVFVLYVEGKEVWRHAGALPEPDLRAKLIADGQAVQP